MIKDNFSPIAGIMTLSAIMAVIINNMIGVGDVVIIIGMTGPAIRGRIVITVGMTFNAIKRYVRSG